MKKIILFLILLFIGGSFLFWQTKIRKTVAPEQKISWPEKLSIERVIFKVEIAQTEKERQKGLAGRKSLCSQCGMLFVFPKKGYHQFWMKDTLIPLDIIWIDENWQVVDFIAYAQPQGKRKQEELPVYTPAKPALYVLELPGGTVNKIRGFKVGSRIKKE